MVKTDWRRALSRRTWRGRVRSTVAQRQAMLAEFERSGLSGPQFARVAGIAYQTFGSRETECRVEASRVSEP